ncbi:MAG TPA: hypothetical protein VEB21_09430 [Terriglobales bacterium]|nr:hypothetical protein [Terriglobales bacterium]
MEAEPQYDDDKESVWGTILGWGALVVFALGFAWYVGAPLIMGERWANKKEEAIQLVKSSKPSGSTETLYDLIRAYSLAQHGKEKYIGEFSWDALQREGPNYEVTLLWTEGTQKRVALWRINLEDKSIWPQGSEANSLVSRVTDKSAS